MTIELVKEYAKSGSISYHVKVDQEFVAGTVRTNLHEAMEVYEGTKLAYTSSREEILIREEV
jgi:hypothetical protein